MSSDKNVDAPDMPDPKPEAEPSQPVDPPKGSKKAAKKSQSSVPKTVEEINESLKDMGSEFGDADVRTLSPEEVAALDAEAEAAALAEKPEPESKNESGEKTAEEPAQSEKTEEPEEQAQAVDEPNDDSPLDDPETEKAIDEIVAEEGDAVLEAEDLERDLEEASQEKTKSKFAVWLTGIWSNPKSRWAIIFGVLFGLIAVGLIPHSRYFVLNTVGIRSSVSLKVLDGGTMQPLKNVTVRAGGASAQTDSDGNAKIEQVRLGDTILQVEKRAFSPIDQKITVGWGSNPLGEFRVSAVGTQYTFFIKDFLSGKPIEMAEAVSGDGNAASDQDGKLVLTLDTAGIDDESTIKVEISAKSYRTENIEISVNNKEEQSVSLVPDRKHVFVSKRSGNYDVYTAYVDGKEEQRIVEGTGIERDDITLVPHQKDGVAALVSTREKVTDANGYLLSTLYVVDTQDGTLVKIDQSEQIEVIGWSDDARLVYVKIAAGASGTDPKRHRLMSFNNNDFADTKELASSNSFNDVVMIGDRIYFAPSNIFQEVASPGAYSINPNGTNQQVIHDQEVYTLVRSNYETLDLNTSKGWYTYTIGSAENAKSSSAPSSQTGRVYIDNAFNDFSLWVDSRDGKGVLLNYDHRAKTEATITSRSGLKLPVYWLNDKYVIYRVSDSKETADYVINTEGGEAKKITDVTNTSGLGRWYYY